MRLLVLVLTAFTLSCPIQTPAAEENSEESNEMEERLHHSPRHSEWVDVEYPHRKVHSFVVYPEAPDRRLSVLVIHENRGMAEWLQAFADQLAEMGYVAVVPDLLSGMGPNGGNTNSFPNQAAATQVISALPPDQVTADLKAVTAYITKQPASNGKVVVVGFCWGGTQAFRFATNHAELAAVCVFYGSGPTDPDAIARIVAPVYGFYGGHDQRINGTIPETERLMKAAGKFYEPILYEGAGHAFMRQAAETNDPENPNKKAAFASWERLLKILAHHRQ